MLLLFQDIASESPLALKLTWKRQWEVITYCYPSSFLYPEISVGILLLNIQVKNQESN